MTGTFRRVGVLNCAKEVVGPFGRRSGDTNVENHCARYLEEGSLLSHLTESIEPRKDE